MKNRKGFTIVELVIVIAVIAILAAVLIPTFSGVVKNANESSALQEARTSLTNVLSGNTQGSMNEAYFAINGGSTNYLVHYDNQKLDEGNIKSGADIKPMSEETTPVNLLLKKSGNEQVYTVIAKSYTLTDKEKAAIVAVTGAAATGITVTEGTQTIAITIGETTYTFNFFVNSDLSGQCVVFVR